MRQTVLDLFNAANTSNFTLDQVELSDPRPTSAGERPNTKITVHTKPTYKDAQFSTTFIYKRVPLTLVQENVPTLSFPLSFKGASIADAIFLIRDQIDLMVNPEDFVSVSLPAENGSVNLVARGNSLGLIGSGLFNVTFA